MKATISPTEAVEQDDGKETMNNENGACIQSSKRQPEANSATINPSKTITVGQRQFFSTKWGNPSGATDVLQLRRIPSQSYQLPCQVQNTASHAREDYYIRPNVPNLKFSEISAHPLENGRVVFKQHSTQQTRTTVWRWISWKQWSRAKPKKALSDWDTMLRCITWGGTC